MMQDYEDTCVKANKQNTLSFLNQQHVLSRPLTDASLPWVVALHVRSDCEIWEGDYLDFEKT